MHVCRAPNPLPSGANTKVRVFLAGSIEMGTAEKWQKKVIDLLDPYVGIVFDPRREEWDSSWEQTASSPEFREQVDWELTALEQADHVLMYFDPATKSPVSLLEMGLYAQQPGKLAVYCPEGFWRKGNVDIVCMRYNVPMANSFESLVGHIVDLSPTVGKTAHA